MNKFLDVSGLYNENCTGSQAINSIVENFSPYLFPFSVEFNILIGNYSNLTINPLKILQN